MWKEKTKGCKKCGGDNFATAKRKNALSGKQYTTRRCRDCTNKTQRKYNKVKGHKVMKKWQEENREYLRAYQREYYKDKYGERNAKHERRLKERYIYNDMDEIQKFYRNCPTGFHVDHIIPHNGKNVSGLHTVNNLQYLSATENLRKYNKFIIQ